MSPAPRNDWITEWAVRRCKDLEDLADLARKGCRKLLLLSACFSTRSQLVLPNLPETCREAAVQTTFSDYSPHAPTGCAGGIHLFVRYTGSPTFQPGTCKPSNNIGLCP